MSHMGFGTGTLLPEWNHPRWSHAESNSLVSSGQCKNRHNCSFNFMPPSSIPSGEPTHSFFHSWNAEHLWHILTVFSHDAVLTSTTQPQPRGTYKKVKGKHSTSQHQLLCNTRMPPLFLHAFASDSADTLWLSAGWCFRKEKKPHWTGKHFYYQDYTEFLAHSGSKKHKNFSHFQHCL